MSKDIIIRAYKGEVIDMMRIWNTAIDDLNNMASSSEDAPAVIYGISQFGPLFEEKGDETVEGVARMVGYCNQYYPFDAMEDSGCMVRTEVTPGEFAEAKLECAMDMLRRAINRTNYRKFGQLLLEMYPEARKESSESDAYIKAAEMAIDAAYGCENCEEDDWGNE